MVTFKSTTVISLGGSLIMPGELDVDFLLRFKKLIASFVNKGNRVIIICGGGKVCRWYQTAAKKLRKSATDTDLDWIGIRATKFNAELVRVMFGDLAYEKVIDDPKMHVKTSRPIIIGAGHLPGTSSDFDAVLVAKTFSASRIFNLSNIDHVYDKDPSQHPSAKKLDSLSWAELQKIVGTKWSPGLSGPFDPKATALARKLSLELGILSGKDLSNVSKALMGKPFKGTIIR